MANNSLSPHGGKLVERVMEAKKGKEKVRGLKIKLPIETSRANEIMGITYGFFSPIEGFMGYKDVDSVCKEMCLESGYVWSVPIVFDLSEEQIKEKHGSYYAGLSRDISASQRETSPYHYWNRYPYDDKRGYE